jgi:hypothetical protein
MTPAAVQPAAYCSVCRGVLPFGSDARRPARRSCLRCGTVFRETDPGAAGRRRARRYLLYGASSGLAGSLLAAGTAMVGASHPLSGAWPQRIALVILPVLALGCLVRSAALWQAAARYERLAPHEWAEVQRRLYVGMIRSDVEEELSRRGWRPGKIRFALESLRPAAPGPAARTRRSA